MFPGAVLGAVLIQTVENGLVLVHADPYVYPLVNGAIIFFVVFVDSMWSVRLARVAARRIRPVRAM